MSAWQEPAPPSAAPPWASARHARFQEPLGKVSSLHLALFLGSIPLKYSRVCPLCPPKQEPCDAQQRKGAGEGLRLSSGLSSVGISTQDRCWTETFKTFKAAGSFNDEFSKSRRMARAALPRPSSSVVTPSKELFLF